MSAGTSHLAGVIEGYYGRTWDHDTRLAIVSLMADMGFNAFLYCPKSDHYLRKRWQAHWPAREWGRLQALSDHAAQQAVLFGVGLSPYALYDSYGLAEQAALKQKIEQLNDLGAPLLALLFDDMPGAIPDLAARQAAIIADVQHWSKAARILVCPTYYSADPVLEKHFGKRPSGYWAQLGEQLPTEIDLFWTGPRVCSERIAAADVKDISRTLQRPLVLWDNYPVNDGAVRSRHLYIEPLPARDPAINRYLRGHFCNPMNQAWLSLPALSGLAELCGHPVSQSFLADALGEDTLRLLHRDSASFLTAGLDGLDESERARLTRDYRALDSPAAREVVEWLNGEYTFDPACLTD